MCIVRSVELFKSGTGARWVMTRTPTVWHLPVADVLQVGHRGVVVALFGAGLELLQPLRRLPRR